tara:strand:+ start:822 stop:1100 length:279 start_codon:yes stop_codon:yes gene_type:complete
MTFIKNALTNYMFNRRARIATAGRYDPAMPRKAAIWRDTVHLEKDMSVRSTAKFVVVEDGKRTLYYDKNANVKRTYGLREWGNMTYAYRVVA